MDKVYNEDSIKRILALIRWGANGLNELFKKEADEIAEDFELEGYQTQADFIKAQFNEIPTFVPMEIKDKPFIKVTDKKDKVLTIFPDKVIGYYAKKNGIF